MFFTRIARVVAFLALVFGIVLMAVGFAAASGTMAPADAKRALSLLVASSTGELVDRGLYASLVAVALGTLSEIAPAIRRSHD